MAVRLDEVVQRFGHAGMFRNSTASETSGMYMSRVEKKPRWIGEGGRHQRENDCTDENSMRVEEQGARRYVLHQRYASWKRGG